jgi:hypothetical protein
VWIETPRFLAALRGGTPFFIRFLDDLTLIGAISRFMLPIRLFFEQPILN